MLFESCESKALNDYANIAKECEKLVGDNKKAISNFLALLDVIYNEAQKEFSLDDLKYIKSKGIEVSQGFKDALEETADQDDTYNSIFYKMIDSMDGNYSTKIENLSKIACDYFIERKRKEGK